MTPNEKIAAWDALSKLADAQQPSAEDVELACFRAGISLHGHTVAAAIQHERRLAARAAVLAELRERALREELEWAVGNCAWCGCFSFDSFRCECGGTQALLAAKAALAAPSGPGVLAQVVEALRLGKRRTEQAEADQFDDALRLLGEDVP